MVFTSYTWSVGIMFQTLENVIFFQIAKHYSCSTCATPLTHIPSTRTGLVFLFWFVFCFLEKSSLQAMVPLLPLIPALWKQRLCGPLSLRQPGLQSEFLNSQSYTKKPCLRETGRETEIENLSM